MYAIQIYLLLPGTIISLWVFPVRWLTSVIIVICPISQWGNNRNVQVLVFSGMLYWIESLYYLIWLLLCEKIIENLFPFIHLL